MEKFIIYLRELLKRKALNVDASNHIVKQSIVTVIKMVKLVEMSVVAVSVGIKSL